MASEAISGSEPIMSHVNVLSAPRGVSLSTRFPTEVRPSSALNLVRT
jgi:hypothetical protein